jgi:hypothetical protein
MAAHRIPLWRHAGRKLMPIFDQTPAPRFLRMLDPKNGLAPGDGDRMVARLIESVDAEPAPLLVLRSQALEGTLTTLRKRLASFEAQTELVHRLISSCQLQMRRCTNRFDGLSPEA